MSRRDLVPQNALIVKYISEETRHRNPSTKYVFISNLVDAKFEDITESIFVGAPRHLGWLTDPSFYEILLRSEKTG